MSFWFRVVVGSGGVGVKWGGEVGNCNKIRFILVFFYG